MRCDVTGGAERHRPFDSNSLFVLRSNYAVLSSVLAALLVAASSAAMQARIINAASPSLADIRRAIASAADGDTVIVPAGTAAWTSALTITKGITIQGQTTVDSDRGTADDQTVLVDNLVRVPGGQGFIHCKTNAGQSLRITGITFTGTGGLTTTAYNGAIKLSGSSNQVRLDHLHFTNLYHSNYIAVYASIRGVADHIVEDHLVGQNGQNRTFNGTNYGDVEWSQPAGYGGSDFFFYEDWYVDNRGHPFSTAGGWDANQGGRFVIRHCHLWDVEILCHGTEIDRNRGGRAQEIYNNDYHWSYNLGAMDGIRSGSMIAHDNTYDGNLPTGYSMQTYRVSRNYQGTPFGNADGQNPWDVNVTEADGSHVDGNPPYVFESGTATGGSESVQASTNSLTDTSKNWTVNQWKNYTAKRVSDGFIGFITSNTNDTLTMQWNCPAGCGGATWRAGDQYEICKVMVALDQPCRGKGDVLPNTASPPPKWPNQVIEPCYSWNNIHQPSGEHINFNPAANTAWMLTPGKDYFNDTPMPGYTPYVYPHPLTKGLPPPEQMTGNATGNPQHNPLKKRQPWGGKQPDRKKAKKAKDGPTNKMADDQDNLGN